MTSNTQGAQDWADEAEQRLLSAAILHIPRLGLTPALLRAVGQATGLSAGDVGLLLPNGPADLVALLSVRHDQGMIDRLAQQDASRLSIREKIATGVAERLTAVAEDSETSRRCAGFLALPHHLSLASRLTWRSADLIWRWAGDTAVDENHYSKRAILSGILVPATLIRLYEGEAAAKTFVDARIENVMSFEKWKAGQDFGQPLRQMAATLSSLRYR